MQQIHNDISGHVDIHIRISVSIICLSLHIIPLKKIYVYRK